MIRLTHERNNGIKSGYWSPNKKDELVARLAEYENTGLDPEEIRAVIRNGRSTTLATITNAQIGELISSSRKEKGLTQRQLAEKAGVAVITIQQYESGKRVPKLEYFIKIAQALADPDTHSGKKKEANTWLKQETG